MEEGQHVTSVLLLHLSHEVTQFYVGVEEVELEVKELEPVDRGAALFGVVVDEDRSVT